MVSFPGNISNASARFAMCSSVDRVKYFLTGGVRCPTDITSQLTTFDPRNRINSTLHPSFCSLMTSHTPLAHPRAYFLPPGSTRHHIPGRYGSTPRWVYSSLSAASVHICQSARPRLPGGGKSPAVPDVVCSNVNPYVVDQPAPWRQHFRIKAVGVMFKMVIESYCHCGLFS